MTTQDHMTRTAEEARTHELFDEESYKERGIEFSPARQIVAMVWRARWQGALTIEQINETGKVLANLLDTPDLQDMVTLMARKKMLRSYRKQGRKLYEVNY